MWHSVPLLLPQVPAALLSTAFVPGLASLAQQQTQLGTMMVCQ